MSFFHMNDIEWAFIGGKSNDDGRAVKTEKTLRNVHQ